MQRNKHYNRWVDTLVVRRPEQETPNNWYPTHEFSIGDRVAGHTNIDGDFVGVVDSIDHECNVPIRVKYTNRVGRTEYGSFAAHWLKKI